LTVAEYLSYVYPLAAEIIAQMSSPEQQAFFDSLMFYYKLDPQPESTIPEGRLVAANLAELPKLNDLYQLSIINPNGFWLRNIYPPRNPYDNLYTGGFGDNSQVEVWHSNVYAGGSGLYYYLSKGSGVFVDLGKTLVARNKLHALQLLGMTAEEIVDSGTVVGYWPKTTNGKLPAKTATFSTLAKLHAHFHGGSILDAQIAVVTSAIKGKSYKIDRLNATGWNVDRAIFELGQQQGYDTIQMTTQANMCNGWGFEIVDLRVNEHQTLLQNLAGIVPWITSRNPFDLTQHTPSDCMKSPFYNLFCSGTMSEIARNYPNYPAGLFAYPDHSARFKSSAIPLYPEW